MMNKVHDQQSQRGAMISDAELLDIHGAARFLRVSEVSVRRYTNSGALRCLRVGGRQERRFQRADLEAFVGAVRPSRGLAEPGPAPGAAAFAGRSADGVDQIAGDFATIEGMPVPWGRHLCQLYETDRGRVQMTVPFLNDGLTAGDACFLIASEPARAHLIDALRRVRGDLAPDIEAGRLRLIDQAHSGNAMLAALDEAFGQAMEEGFGKLRLVGDMAWFLDQGLSGDELVNFETRYDSQIGHSYPIISLCLYDARRFSGIEILHALKSHADTFDLPLSRFLLR
jgi:transcriptional repressor of dcmA and dcmR